MRFPWHKALSSTFNSKAFILLFILDTAFALKAQEEIFRAELALRPKEDLPFKISFPKEKKEIYIYNGKEKIVITELSKKGDTTIARLPVFDSELRFAGTDTLKGFWINNSRTTENIIPFTAVKGENYLFFPAEEPFELNVTGKWETYFSPNTPGRSFAIGQFTQLGNKVEGTFLTTTGDYRYLEGNVSGDSLFLSCFDGSHAYLFKAVFDDDTLKGKFYSGSHWEELWVAHRGEAARLPDPERQTWVKMRHKESAFNFKFPDLKGDSVSLKDDKFKNKVVVVQLMGSWCPNCMDETAFLSGFYAKEKLKKKGFEIIGLAFEKTSDVAKARANVSRLAKRFDAKYTFLLAGTSNKDSASKKLPTLSKITSFPTTLFIDKKGRVRKIYTGFNGPATGKEYEKFKLDFYAFVRKLESE